MLSTQPAVINSNRQQHDEFDVFVIIYKSYDANQTKTPYLLLGNL